MRPRPLLATGIVVLLSTLPVLAQQGVDPIKPDDETEKRLLKLEEQLRSRDERTQWRAIHAATRMGKSAVPLLTKLFAESPRQGKTWSAPAAAKALARIGSDAVECLPTTLKVLEKGNQAQKKLALDVLGAVGPYNPDERGAYMDAAYNSRRVRVRERRGKRIRRLPSHLVVGCMLRLSEDPTMGIDDLIEHLKGQSAAHREMAVDLLALRDKDVQRAIPALREVVTADKQPRKTTFRLRGTNWSWAGSISMPSSDRIRGKATLLLMKLGAAKDLPAGAYIALLDHGDPAVRHRAVLELGSFGEKVGAKGVGALARAIMDQDKLVAWDAITALGMIGPKAKAAVPRLEGLARSQDKAKVARAQAALRQIRKDENENR
jgi:hypothetical protein